MMDVIVFGKGRYYKAKEKTILDKYNVVALIDNSIKPGSREVSDIDGIMVYSPEDINNLPTAQILLMSVRFFDMRNQLIRLNVSDSRIVFGINEEPDYDNAEKVLHENGYYLSLDNDKYVLSNETTSLMFEDEQGYKQCVNKIYRESFPIIDVVRNMPLKPISRRFGNEHGTPIDRYYIESFIRDNSDAITGDVVEIADNEYTTKYGHDYISHVLHVGGWGGSHVIKGNFVTGEGIIENYADCIICTQTIQMIFEFDTAFENIKKMLKPGGVLLLTVHGISQLSMYDYVNWGEYWRFTNKSLGMELEKHFGACNYEVSSFGNLKIAIAQLMGCAIEDMDESDFEYNDEQYPLIICGIARKRN